VDWDIIKNIQRPVLVLPWFKWLGGGKFCVVILENKTEVIAQMAHFPPHFFLRWPNSESGTLMLNLHKLGCLPVARKAPILQI